MYFGSHRRYLEAIKFYIVCQHFYWTNDKSVADGCFCTFNVPSLRISSLENFTKKMWVFFHIYMKQTEWAFKYLEWSLNPPLWEFTQD